VRTRFDVTELERDVLVHVRSVAVFVDAHLGMTERLLDRHERGQRLVLDLDQPAGRLGRLLVLGRHRRDGVADHPHALVTERLLVLDTGRIPNFTRGRSAPVMTAYTPGSARARDVSISLISAWGWIERSSLP